ncbi:MAG: 1-deoxy-D-xylulose-5-phosphate reductoisomerase [Armatimonadota bacterium]|nr:1-deoxy-D-xylulose-5-phosphate reductoisomerase [Armatimonadota bacterium]
MSDPKPIVILGSTGSIGQQTLAVAQALPHRLRVVGLAAHSNYELFARQIADWRPAVAALWDEAAAHRVPELVDLGSTRLLSGPQGVEEVATYGPARLVLGAMLGAAGLAPTVAAIQAGKDLAIANKETLVAAGEIVVAAAREKNVALLPVDSEHSAIAQCLLGESTCSVESLTITASGGPFVDTPRAEIAAAGAERALKHPTWTMGRKITIDSATLMNKALECIEARWLFDIPIEKINVVVHRQSIVHSLVTFCDRSVKAQLGVPDMRLPIQWALLYPERVPGAAPPLDITTMGPLTFEPPDPARFPALRLARRAMELGGTAPAAMNAANEVAVQAFLDGATNFYGITACIEAVLERQETVGRPSLQDVYEADAAARRRAHEFLKC